MESQRTRNLTVSVRNTASKGKLGRSDLHPYQEKAVNWIKEHPYCGLFLEMGLGKTISTLTALAELKAKGEVKKVLILAPKRVAEHTWSDEISRWSHLSGLTYTKIVGTPRQRFKALHDEVDIYLMGRDNVKWLFDHYRGSFDTLVIDELSGFKKHNTQRFKSLKRVRKSFKRIIGLTGTPTPNSLMDLFSQLYILDGGTRLGKYITEYRMKYFTPGRGVGRVVYEWILKKGADKQIYSSIGDICMSMKSEDYLDLPRVNYINEPIGLTKEEYSEYLNFKQTQVAKTPDGEVTAGNMAVLGGKLTQWAGGAVYDDEGSLLRTNDAKLERLKEMLEEIHTPVLIAYHYKHELERLRKAFPSAKTLSNLNVLEQWNRGEVPILLGHPASMGHGLNIQKGGHVIIWYTLTWSLELYQQMNARLARQGQQEKVFIYHLLVKGTIDERILRVLQCKETLQETLMQELK